MKIELDDDMRAILEALRKYPDGISVNKLYKSLKDRRGRYLMSKPTFAKKLQKLKDMELVIEEAEGEWKRGKRKILKIKDSHRVVVEALSEVRRYLELFEELVRRFLIEMMKMELEGDEDARRVFNIKINKLFKIIKKELEEKRIDIIKSEMSERFKKELIYETVAVEFEITKKYTDFCFENKIMPFLLTPSDWIIEKEVEEEFKKLKEVI